MSILHKEGINTERNSYQLKKKHKYIWQKFSPMYIFISLSDTNIVSEISFNLFIESIQNKNKDCLSLCVSVVRTLEWWPGCSICTPSWSQKASCQIPVQ